MNNITLPQGWITQPLGSLVSPRTDRVSPSEYSDFPFIGLEHVESNTMRLLGSVAAKTMKSSAVRFRRDDILYGRLRPYLNKVASPGVDGLCSAEFIVFPDQQHLRSAFLKYRLNAADFVSFSSHLNEGDRPRVAFEQFSSFVILLPPEPEQRRIVAKIEELFSELDAGVAALQRVRANLKRYRASVLQAAVTGKLTEAWRAKHRDVEPASELLRRILAERRRKWEQEQLTKFTAASKTPPKGWQSKYVEPTAPDTTGLPQLPAGWCWASVEQLLARSEYGTSVKCDYGADGPPVLRIPNIAKGRIDLEDIKRATVPLTLSQQDSLQTGDLLMCRTNGSISLIGKSALVPPEFQPNYTFASYLLRFRLVDRTSLPKWLHLYFTSYQGRRFIESNAASSAGQHNISLSLIHSMPLPVPSCEEQEAIALEVERRLSIVDETEAQVERGLLRAARLRQSILKRAFEGKLVPQDPSDEPADKLLERIQQQRAGTMNGTGKRTRRAKPVSESKQEK